MVSTKYIGLSCTTVQDDYYIYIVYLFCIYYYINIFNYLEIIISSFIIEKVYKPFFNFCNRWYSADITLCIPYTYIRYMIEKPRYNNTVKVAIVQYSIS